VIDAFAVFFTSLALPPFGAVWLPLACASCAGQQSGTT
jgi:hypothetical protein